MRCGLCRYWREGQDHAFGWCQKNAPPPELLRAEGPGVDTFYPPMPADEGCGDWAHRLRPWEVMT